MRIRIPLALMLLLVAVSFSEAEESARGRLADGRAYRTDEEGNQLVDYIAELEVSAEALNRRIVGLEDELAEKGRIIERLNRGESGAAAFSGTLTERTLAGSPNGEAKDSVEDPAITRANREIARLQRELSESRRTPKQDSSEMNVRNELSKVYATLDSTKGELSSVKAALESERRLRDQDQATYAALSRECSTARTSSQQNCDLEVAAAVREVTSTGVSREAALREESSRERDMQRAELQAVQAERDSLKGELAQISADLRATQSALTAAQGDLVGARSALAAAQVERSAPRGGGQLGDSVFTQRQVVGRDYASRSRSAVVDSIRGTMTSDLNQVRGLVATRDNLFAAAAGRGDQRLQLKPSPLLSTRRRTLNDIAAGIRSAEQVHELTALRSDLTEIRALVQGDIDLLRRTGRAG